MNRLVVLACFVWVAFAVPAAAEVVVLPGAHDNTLFADANGDTSNGAGPAVFAGRNGQGRTTRALLAFDLEGVIAPDAHIDSVVLTLFVSSASDPSAARFSLHRMSRAWGEGQSSSSGGSGAPATTGDATWLYAFYPTETWNAPGGDFDTVESAVQTCGDVGFYSWSGPGLVSDVAWWLQHPAENHGWMLRGVESGTRTVRRFDSREAAQTANRPTLAIHFSRREPVSSIARTWGGLKDSYR